MRWFKHDSNANQDTKLKKLRMKYGLEGYGLYWYCIELICERIDESNTTLELEDDAEIIGYTLNIHQEKVQEMMEYMVKIALFEDIKGVITCFKLAKRIDKSMTSNPRMRKIISEIKENSKTDNHDEIMTESCKPMQDKTRLDQIRLDQIRLDQNKPKKPKIPYQQIVDLYNKILKDLPCVVTLTPKRETAIKKLFNFHKEHKKISWWEDYFTFITKSNFLMGRVQTYGEHENWKCDFDFVININKFVKIIEGKYK
jgi:hypothetical protein